MYIMYIFIFIYFWGAQNFEKTAVISPQFFVGYRNDRLFSHTNPYISNVTQQCRCSPMLIFRAWATCGLIKSCQFTMKCYRVRARFLVSLRASYERKREFKSILADLLRNAYATWS